VPYYEAASSLAKALQSGVYERGIAICGTGAGASLIINKFKGIYCVACESVFTAQRISLINNANVLAMGEKVVSQEMACEMAREWLNGVWCEGFDEQRRKNNERGFQVLQEIESRHFK
jgi:ribose 5-phosphate isomerase B